MPELQTMSGRAARPPITVVVGSEMQLKVVPLRGERLPITVTIAGPGVATIVAVNNRTSANFTTFRLRGGTAGDARLVISDVTNAHPLTVALTVQAAIALPADSTEAGVLARLLLAESPGPGRADYTPENSLEAMTLMRVVLENRRRNPNARWGSAGATSLGDVVRARGQFEGFGNYPTLSAAIVARNDDMLAIANNASDARQARIRAHVEQVIAVASGQAPPDPTATGLYWWRTQGSGAPGTGVTLYKSVLGNSFYRESK